MKKTIAAVLVLVMLSGVSSAAQAAKETANPPSAEEMALDVVLVRPLGIVSIAAGTVFFIVSLPFTIPSRSVGVAARRLVAEPFKFTFTRPIGEREGFNYYDMESPGKE
jgi:hypothetical protein